MGPGVRAVRVVRKRAFYSQTLGSIRALNESVEGDVVLLSYFTSPAENLRYAVQDTISRMGYLFDVADGS